MIPSKASFIEHFRWLRKAATSRGVGAILDMDSMRVFLRKDGRHWLLVPRFLGEVEGVTRYFPHFTDESTHLAGWTFTQSTGWPAAKDKLIFKRSALRHGLPVPAFSLDETPGMTDVVVKRSAGSFGEHVHGPYRASADRALKISEGEFYEQFVAGRNLKVWYWRDTPVVLERDLTATVEGDGQSPVRDLIVARIGSLRRMTPAKRERILARCAAVLAYDGSSLDAIPAAGERRRIEFRYGVEVMQNGDREQIDLRADADPQWRALHDAGPTLLQMVPQELRGHILFTVDAVQDDAGAIWLLEMNSHPMVHPLLYDYIVDELASSTRATPQDHAQRVAA